MLNICNILRLLITSNNSLRITDLSEKNTFPCISVIEKKIHHKAILTVKIHLLYTYFKEKFIIHFIYYNFFENTILHKVRATYFSIIFNNKINNENSIKPQPIATIAETAMVQF